MAMLLCITYKLVRCTCSQKLLYGDMIKIELFSIHVKGVNKVCSVKNSKFSFSLDLLIFMIFSAVADMNWYC